MFKTGDLVRCVKATSHLTVGCVYKVAGFVADANLIELCEPDGYQFYVEQFEMLIPANTPSQQPRYELVVLGKQGSRWAVLDSERQRVACCYDLKLANALLANPDDPGWAWSELKYYDSEPIFRLNGERVDIDDKPQPLEENGRPEKQENTVEEPKLTEKATATGTKDKPENLVDAFNQLFDELDDAIQTKIPTSCGPLLSQSKRVRANVVAVAAAHDRVANDILKLLRARNAMRPLLEATQNKTVTPGGISLTAYTELLAAFREAEEV